ncbi:MAG: hypothetical protein ACRC3B_00970 [Bacteroidia bacterium]
MRFSLLLPAFLFLLTGFSSHHSAPDVTCRKSKLTFGNYTINTTWSLAELTQKIGQPNRKIAAGDTIFVYDSLGIFVRKPAPGSEYPSRIREFKLFMTQIFHDKNAPVNAFPGNVVVGNMKLTSTTPMFEVKEKLKGFSEQETAIPHTLKYYAVQEELFIWLDFTDNELDLETITFEIHPFALVRFKN